MEEKKKGKYFFATEKKNGVGKGGGKIEKGFLFWE